MNVHFRQGDVLLVKVDKMPPDAVPVAPDGDRVVLAYGEVTGHAHALPAVATALYEHAEGRFLKVETPSALVHEEHAPIDLVPGVYRVVRQREYAPREVRFVAD
jgi:hypothetical protein